MISFSVVLLSGAVLLLFLVRVHLGFLHLLHVFVLCLGFGGVLLFVLWLSWLGLLQLLSKLVQNVTSIDVELGVHVHVLLLALVLL